MSSLDNPQQKETNRRLGGPHRNSSNTHSHLRVLSCRHKLMILQEMGMSSETRPCRLNIKSIGNDIQRLQRVSPVNVESSLGKDGRARARAIPCQGP